MTKTLALDNCQDRLFDQGRFESEQYRMLMNCVGKDVGLMQELQSRHLSVEDLHYEMEASPSHGDYVTLDRFRRTKNGIPFVSLFAGCGGMDLGFEAAGFNHCAAVEINQVFADTMRKNRPEWNVLGPPLHSGDVSNIYDTANVLRHFTKTSGAFEGVFVGGPPCQPFSIAANQRFSKSGADFKRTGFQHVNGNLLFSYIDLIEMFVPRAFVIENVTGLIDVDNGEQMANAIQRLRHVGYQVSEPLILNAADFHVPQNRFRLFLVGVRGGAPFQSPKKADRASLVGAALKLGRGSLMNHIPRDHKPESILRYMQLAVGERDQLGRVDRLDPNKPSKTIIAGGTKGGGRSHLHPYVPRTLTVRECARIQTFPDSYEFIGPIARQFTQVGNAVPPILAAQIADSVAKAIS